MQTANRTGAGSSGPKTTKETTPPPHDVVLKACANFALTLIRSNQSVASLFKFGPLANHLPPAKRRTCQNAEEVTAWVKTFLGKLSQDFVKLTPKKGMGCEAAEFEPSDWSQGGKPWHPKQAGVMYLNEAVRCTSSPTRDYLSVCLSVCLSVWCLH
jgi:hypothetical protein